MRPCSVRLRRRALDGDHGEVLGAMLDGGIEASGRLTEPVLEVRRVDHDPEPLLREPVDVAVVDHGPVGIDERTVADGTGRHLFDVDS